jgi:membrane protease YdiL (CAAX protease family)
MGAPAGPGGPPAAPPPAPPPPGLAFDPATGDWLPVGGAAAYDPEAPRWTPLAIVMTVLLALDLGLLGLAAVAQLLLPLVPPELLPSPTETAFTPTLLWLAVAINTVAFILIPVLWVVATRQGGWHGALHYLKLERPAMGMAWGLLVGFATLIGVVLLGLAARALGVPTQNPQLDSIAAAIDWPLVFAIAITAGVGEEILFRGILQRWVGVWIQAALFGILHASYGTILQVVGPFLIGLFYGFLVKRGARLWVVITAHVAFDVAALSLAMLFGTQ